MGDAVDLHLLTGPASRPVAKPAQSTAAKPAG
jgi:hypothetical protein